MMQKRFLSYIVMVGILCASLFAGEFKKTFDRFHPADGDTIVFLGDSITHQCLYTQYIEDYFYTRFPHRRLYFHNAGVSGDKAVQALERFDYDVTRLGPEYVSVLIGMNDGLYTRFDNEIFNTYKKDMTTLLDKIAETGAAAVAITPTMFDGRMAIMGKNWLSPETAGEIHYNSVLAFFGAWLRETAEKRGTGFVDMYEPLNRITREQRKIDPEYTLIEDAVHPGPGGQLVMALAFLTGVDADPLVSKIFITRENGKWTAAAQNGTVTNMENNKTNTAVAFTFTARGLPWVVPGEASDAYKISGAGVRMSREVFQVVGLEPGNYRLTIDGEPVGDYSYIRLAEGIQLQENPKTPQYRQALAVAELNKKRNDQAIRPLRNLWLKRKFKKDGGDWNKKISQLSPRAFKEWDKEFKKRVKVFEERAAAMTEKIYRINKPVPHMYVLRRTGAVP